MCAWPGVLMMLPKYMLWLHYRKTHDGWLISAEQMHVQWLKSQSSCIVVHSGNNSRSRSKFEDS